MSKSVYESLLNQIGGQKYMKLRSHIISRTEPAVSRKQLTIAYAIDKKMFKDMLEQLTLMPVNVNSVLKVMELNGWTPETMWDAYSQSRNRRIESIISVPYNCI